MPADHPDQTTGAVRGRRTPGRHRTDRPAEPPQTPEVGFPAVHQPGLPSDRPRHARGGGPAGRRAPRADSGYDRYGDRWADERRADERRPDEGWPDEGWADEGWADEGWADERRPDERRPDDGWSATDRPDEQPRSPMRAGPDRGARRRHDGARYPDASAAGAYPAPEIAGPFEAEFDVELDTGHEPPRRAPAGPRGRGLPRRPGRGPVDPAPAAAMPSRRPGDPPGAPAELFVETTTETAALTPELLGRHDAARAAADPGPDPGTGTDAADPPGRPRVLGLALPFALPGWADRLLRRDPDDTTAEGHGHGHGHGPAHPAGRRVRILIAALLVPCALATLVGIVLLRPTGGPPDTARPGSQQPVRAQVTATTAADCSPGSGTGGCVALVVHMADGPRPGRDLVQVVPLEPGTPTFAVGDRVVLSWSGADADDAGSYQVVDFQRDSPLLWLAGLFAVAVLVLGRWRGLAALVALGLSFVVLLFFVVPAILAGRDPLAVAVVGACLIMFAVLYLTHGPSARTSTAVLGTLLSLALIGALGAGFSAAARLTGLDDQTSNLIATLGTGVDARGLLLAGVVIGALGVLDDVTVTQTSAVWELRHANPDLSARRLFTAAMRIGRDHVASAVNTLVLAYAGAALPLLLLFSLSGRGFGDIVTSQDVATEIVRTLVGSIGLVASVPITTALAAAVAARETVPAEVTGSPSPGTTLAPDRRQR